MIRTRGRNKERLCVNLEIILRDFLVDILRGRVKNLMRRRPLRHFHWLLHNDIERDNEAENDRKEVDRQRSDVGCGAVLEAY